MQRVFGFSLPILKSLIWCHPRSVVHSSASQTAAETEICCSILWDGMVTPSLLPGPEQTNPAAFRGQNLSGQSLQHLALLSD